MQDWSLLANCLFLQSSTTHTHTHTQPPTHIPSGLPSLMLLVCNLAGITREDTSFNLGDLSLMYCSSSLGFWGFFLFFFMNSWIKNDWSFSYRFFACQDSVFVGRKIVVVDRRNRGQKLGKSGRKCGGFFHPPRFSAVLHLVIANDKMPTETQSEGARDREKSFVGLKPKAKRKTVIP